MPGLPIPGSEDDQRSGKPQPAALQRQVMVAYITAPGTTEEIAFIICEGRVWGPYDTAESLQEAWRELKAEGSI